MATGQEERLKVPARRRENHTDVIRKALAPTPADWLDACCWGCGSENVALHPDGRLLCRTCRSQLLTDEAVDPLQFTRRAYWESHALEQCWRCMVVAVDHDDELGLCRSCFEHLEGR